MSIAASTLFNDIQTTAGMLSNKNPNKNIKQKFVYVNPCVIGVCQEILNAGTDKWSSHKEKSRHTACTKGYRPCFFAIFKILLSLHKT